MLKLYSAQACPFAHRCRLALTLGNLDHERIEISLADMPEWYRQISPNQSVPLLEHNEHKIWESAIINEYLADAFPDRNLLPQDPLIRARFRLAINWVGNSLVPGFYQVLRNDQSDAVEKMHEFIADIPGWMSGDGPFWLGSQPSLADANIYPWFERWVVLEHYRNFKAKWPARVQDWLQALKTQPFIQQEAGDIQSYINSYSRYAVAAQTV